jgi:hypothetical protein
LDAVPEELRQRDRWVVWKEIPDADPQRKPRKVPVDPRTGRNASPTDPATWASFEEAEKALRGGGYSGLMFAIHPDDGYVFVDVDDCRNVNSKAVSKQAREILTLLNSYAEVSPSGTGVHVLLKGKKPGDRCRAGKLEVYDHARFATITGRVMTKWGTGSVEERQAELEQFYAKYVASGPSGPQADIPDEQLPEDKLAKLLENATAKELYSGSFDGQYPSQSEADWHLTKIAVALDWNDTELKALLKNARKNAGAGEKYEGYYQLTISRAKGTPVELATAHSVFRTYLLLPDLTILNVTLAVVASSHLPGDPCLLHLVGPPSTAKTETLNAVNRWPCVYAVSELTASGFVSGRDSDDGKDHSLMPHLKSKTLIIKDLTPTLQLPRDQRNRLLGRLRDGFDGRQSIHTAMVGTRTHEATFNCLTGVTNEIEQLGRYASLGERYLMYRHVPPEPIASALKALDGASNKDYMRSELARVACGVLIGVDQDCVPECPQEVKERIAHLATLLATMRTHVQRDGNHHVTMLPEPEGTPRIAQQLHKLGQGLALVNRRTEVTKADLGVITRVVLDSMPLIRREILRMLVRHRFAKPKPLTAVFETATGLGESAVREHLGNLQLLGVCVPRTQVVGTSWELSKRFLRLTGGLWS